MNCIQLKAPGPADHRSKGLHKVLLSLTQGIQALHLRPGLDDRQIAVGINDALDILCGAQRLLDLKARLQHR